MYTWAKCPCNEQELRVFTEQLYSILSSCLVRLRKRSNSSFKYCCGKMQSLYHQMRISEDFHKMWRGFFEATTGKSASPIIYHYLDHSLVDTTGSLNHLFN